MAEYPDPDSRNVLEPGCSRCHSLVESRERIAWGNGSLDADVVVVGEAPAFGDPEAKRWRGGNWTGMAYTSRHSGRRVRDLFDDAGIGSADRYFTNAVKCFPADEGTAEEPPSNRQPTPEERANCRTHLAAEIWQLDPGVVATTGKHATAAVVKFDTSLAFQDDERRDRESNHLPNGFLDSVLNPARVRRST